MLFFWFVGVKSWEARSFKKTAGRASSDVPVGILVPLPAVPAWHSLSPHLMCPPGILDVRGKKNAGEVLLHWRHRDDIVRDEDSDDDWTGTGKQELSCPPLSPKK